MTDENKDVEKAKKEANDKKNMMDSISEELNKRNPEKGKGKSSTKPPKGPQMFDFGKEMPPEIAELLQQQMRMRILEDLTRNKDNVIEQNFTIHMPYNNTCKAYIQTKSGFLCINNKSEIDLGHNFLDVISQEIDRDNQKKLKQEMSESPPEGLPGTYGINQENPDTPTETKGIDYV